MSEACSEIRTAGAMPASWTASGRPLSGEIREKLLRLLSRSSKGAARIWAGLRMAFSALRARRVTRAERLRAVARLSLGGRKSLTIVAWRGRHLAIAAGDEVSAMIELSASPPRRGTLSGVARRRVRAGRRRRG